MIVETLTLGNIEITKDQLIWFEQGLPGFEHLRSFALIHLEGSLPVKQLQSVEEPAISFLVVDPFGFYPDYEWDLPESIQFELKIHEASALNVFSIITIPSDVAETTINLMAPIIVNFSEQLGKQIILQTSRYQARHLLFAGTKDQA
ncbi:flagellar assembly protein FliW [Paenibacillus sp. 598K]|uniref:flagellar assembly protein FliW n=1 Tax=Paenibacillus sp. 598K TaxID=1117987 RepID=UPI000FFABD00|nr:flagellar assembly protein FliW [Paenibacillus sp. 598K]GBF76282.1 flagellar assembly protein FliW [Paenibacillus sp. 598K]